MQNGKPAEAVLIIAPVGRDAAVMSSALTSHGFENEICEGPAAACQRLAQGAAALLITEEALELPGISDLLEVIRSQLPWSELPVIILTSGGESRLMQLLDVAANAAGSVTLLERPMTGSTLLRSVQGALRSRRRQYQARELIEEHERKQQLLRESEERYRSLAASLEKTVGERTHDLRSINEQLEAFVYFIAHDLRAPLRSMIGYSQLLVDDYGTGLEASAQNLLKRIQTSSEFMDRLLLDLLAYGRTARSPMELGPVDVRRAWETALFQCATQIDRIHAEVETDGPLPTVRAHEATLGQCLANLLSNALKFVAPGVQPRVRCWAQPIGDFFRVWVEDNGIGIAADQHERVFRVFERLNGSRYAGTGIGLSIVRKGVERMGGRLGLESEVGKGSRFWVELPKAV